MEKRSPIQVNRSQRVEQARRELGRTTVSRFAARLLVALVAVAMLTPPIVQLAADGLGGRGALPALEPLIEGLRRAPRADGLPAANRVLADAIEQTEDRLEEESWLRARLLPPTQWLLSATLGLGNEQVLAASGGEWYFVTDFEYSVGRGFLDREVLARRSLEENVQPDPVAAIRSFSDWLARRGIALLVVPVPGKPAISPRPLASGPVEPPVHNVSYREFLRQLTDAGIEVYDPTADLLRHAAAGQAAFLRTDTHWTPGGLEVVAAAIASRLTTATGLARRPGEYFRRPVLVNGRGDLVSLLRLPDGSRLRERETVEVGVVLGADGRPWRPVPTGEILLLGDSFTNVYSEAGLGWGSGAGLAEQLSFFLAAPVDRIARNAGGAHQSRQDLAAELAAGRDRLRGKKAVVYQFAARELAVGDWRLVEAGRGD